MVGENAKRAGQDLQQDEGSVHAGENAHVEHEGLQKSMLHTTHGVRLTCSVHAVVRRTIMLPAVSRSCSSTREGAYIIPRAGAKHETLGHTCKPVCTAKVAVGDCHEGVEDEGPVVIGEHLALLRQNEGDEEEEAGHGGDPQEVGARDRHPARQRAANKVEQLERELALGQA